MNDEFFTCSTGWIAPDGTYFPCGETSLSHEIEAENLLLKFYGIESGICGDKLIERGWIKVTDSLMFDKYYIINLTKHI